MFQTAWLFVTMVTSGKLPELYISLVIFTRLTDRLSGKMLPAQVSFVLDGHISACTQIM